MDPNNFWKQDSDPHQSEKPVPHQSKKSGALEAQNETTGAHLAAVGAHNRGMKTRNAEDLLAYGSRYGITSTRSRIQIRFKSERLGPDAHQQSEKSDPDPH
jgi:hypothetical protein